MSLSPQESLRGSKLPAFPTSSSFAVSSERFSPPPPRHRVGVNAIPARNSLLEEEELGTTSPTRALLSLPLPLQSIQICTPAENFRGKKIFLFFFFLRRKNSTPRDSSSPSDLDSKTESTNSAKARRFVRSFERRESEPRHIEAFPLFFRATVFTQHRLPSRGVSVLIVNRPSFVGCSNSAVECNYFGTLFQSQWRIKIKGEDFNLNCTIYN